MTVLGTPSAADIPGLVWRRFAGEGDLADAIRVGNAEWEADGVSARRSLDEQRAWWSHPSEQFDPARDVDIVELDGRMVAIAERSWIDSSDGVREYRSRCWVDPSARRRGIGTAMLRRNEAKARALAATHDVDRPRAFGFGTADTSVGAPILAERSGYEPVRWFADMERSLMNELPEIPRLPDGLNVRPASVADAPAIWRADHDAFRDHWGGFDDSEESYRRWLDSPEFQPDLMVVAWDGDEVAAAVINAVFAEENRQLGLKRGWLESVFTRRAWRRRGLARALIVRSLHLLRDRGLGVAALGVDADNPLGAFGLYESAGFAVTERFTQWRKPMDLGLMAVDLRPLFRPYAGEPDLPAIVRVMNDAAAADGVDEVWPVEGIRSWFAHPTDHFDATHDVVIGELDGEVVATGRLEWVDTRDGRNREYRHFSSVAPSHRGRGIGTAMVAEMEALGRARAAEHASDRPRVLMSFAPAGRPAQGLLEANGYEVARWFFDMLRPTLDAIDLPPMPDGLELRPVSPEQHETIWRANREAFRDHWGGSDESMAVMERILGDPDTDTSLWLVAWDGDEVAGGVWNEIRSEENDSLGVRRGWLDSVFTRRAWRRRGLAGALIGRSLLLLRERGMTSAMLGVDADNPTGALGLYEAAGFEVHDRFVALRKPMDGPAT